jgi:signal peptidase I
VRFGGSRVLRARWYRGAVVLAAALLTGIGITLAAQTAGIHAARVASGSMSPSIDRGDWILVRDLDRNHGHTIRRGDIVVFTYPLGTTGRAIKRVVAIGGDTVTVGGDAISVNGHAVPIARRAEPSRRAAPRRAHPQQPRVLLGDNTPVSIDSRSFGPVSDTDVIGRVLFTAPTPVTLPVLLLAIAITVLAAALAMVRRRRTRPATPR